MKGNLLMITGLGSARDLASGKRGAFYHTLSELHHYWDRIDIIAPRIRSEFPGEKIIFDNVHVHISDWPLILHPAYFVLKAKDLHEKLNFKIATVQEFPPFYNGIAAMILHWLTGLKYILEIHHIPGYPRAASFKEKLYCLLTRWFIAWDAAPAAAVRVVNKNQTPGFLKNAGVPEFKIHYVPSVYLENLAPSKLDKKFDVLAVGRLEPNKNFPALLKAAVIIKKTYPDFVLRIVGRGPLYQDLKNQIRALGLEKNVELLGWVDAGELKTAYETARIFVNPSLNEGGPRVLLEAMALGTPVISTPVGLAEDLIRDKENGILCGWSSKELAQAIEMLLKDEVLRERLAEKAPEAAKDFEKVSAIRNYAEFLQNL